MNRKTPFKKPSSALNTENKNVKKVSYLKILYIDFLKLWTLIFKSFHLNSLYELFFSNKLIYYIRIKQDQKAYTRQALDARQPQKADTKLPPKADTKKPQTTLSQKTCAQPTPEEKIHIKKVILIFIYIKFFFNSSYHFFKKNSLHRFSFKLFT